MEALAEDKEYTTLLRDWRQRQSRQGIDDEPKEYTIMTEASEKEDEHRDYNKKREASTEDIRRVQGIGYDNRGRSGLTMGPVD